MLLGCNTYYSRHRPPLRFPLVSAPQTSARNTSHNLTLAVSTEDAFTRVYIALALSKTSQWGEGTASRDDEIQPITVQMWSEENVSGFYWKQFCKSMSEVDHPRLMGLIYLRQGKADVCFNRFWTGGLFFHYVLVESMERTWVVDILLIIESCLIKLTILFVWPLAPLTQKPWALNCFKHVKPW